MFTEFDVFLFIAFVVACSHIVVPEISDVLARRRYEKERARFRAEVQSCRKPDWVPTLITPRGGISIDPNDLMYTQRFRDQLEGAKNLVRNIKTPAS